VLGISIFFYYFFEIEAYQGDFVFWCVQGRKGWQPGLKKRKLHWFRAMVPGSQNIVTIDS
jgi:hypothetical protein